MFLLSGDTLSGKLGFVGSGTGADMSVGFQRVLTLGMSGMPVEKGGSK